MGIADIVQRLIRENIRFNEAIRFGLLNLAVIIPQQGAGILDAQLIIERLSQHLHDITDLVRLFHIMAQGMQTQRLLGSTEIFEVIFDVAQKMIEITLQIGNFLFHILMDIHFDRLLNDQLAVANQSLV